MTSIEPEEVSEYKDDDKPNPRGLIRIKYNFSDVDVRRWVIELGRTYCTGLLSSSVLRNTESVKEY